jgi:hypothetical protein
MGKPNWGLITSGATFESLVATLVFFEDSRAALFGRRGKDGGQDALSGDGTRVFQAKHHESNSSASAIADAKKEAEKIKKYQAPDHPRYHQWQGVKSWRLATNVPFNPTDNNVWNTEVVPLFKGLGLDADYWEQAHLEALLAKYPEVSRVYFESETRVFLSIPEKRERLPEEEPFLRRQQLGTFLGRTCEIDCVRQFLEGEKLFLLVHGAGGVGKTRLLLEAAESIAEDGRWQVLWGNVVTMLTSDKWFEGILPERATLLLLDEPEDAELLQILVEQLSGHVGRATRWKVALAVRSPKDPVLRYLQGPRVSHRVQELALHALPQNDAESICNDLLQHPSFASMTLEQREETARVIAKRVSPFPIWLTLAVHLLETQHNLANIPESSRELAELYLREITDRQSDISPRDVLQLLRWIALLGTIDRSNDTTIRFIGEGAGVEDANQVRVRMLKLVQRRALTERGAKNRLVEIKPDVLRDHILKSWLSQDLGYGDEPVVPSSEAKALVGRISGEISEGHYSPFAQSILTSLGRTQLLLNLSGQNISLLGEFFDSQSRLIPELSASRRLALAQFLANVAVFSPTSTVEMIRVLRTSQVGLETIDQIFSTRTLGHDDIVLALAWPTLHAALGARTPSEQQIVIHELCALVEEEADIGSKLPRGLPNDGKRASGILRRVLEGGPQFWPGFDVAAKQEAETILNQLCGHTPSAARMTLATSLVGQLLELQRHESWNDDLAVHWRTRVIQQGEAAWNVRDSLVEQIQRALANDDTPRESRTVLWTLFALSHRSVNQTRTGMNGQELQGHHDVLIADLRWAVATLASKRVGIRELSAARELWHWHHEFEEDVDLKNLAEQLESLYASNELAEEFEPLLNVDDVADSQSKALHKADELLAGEGVDELTQFIERAIQYFEDPRDLNRLNHVAAALGVRATSSTAVRTFVQNALNSATISPSSQFGVAIASAWISSLRNGPDGRREIVNTLRVLLDACASELQRITLVATIYNRFTIPPKVEALGDGELAELISLAELFLKNTAGPTYLGVIGPLLQHSWPTISQVIEECVTRIPPDQRASAIRQLVESVYSSLRNGSVSESATDLHVWLLNQLLTVPDLDKLGDNLKWYIVEILKVTGRAPITWLPDALMLRIRSETKPGEYRAVGFSLRLSDFVQQVTPDNCDSTEVYGTITKLLDLVSDRGSVGYYLPELAKDVDPQGLVVATEVAHRASLVSTVDSLYRLARCAGAYAEGTSAWRMMAKSILSKVPTLSPEEQETVFSGLVDHGTKSWSGFPGEVPQLFIDQVEHAQRFANDETDPTFQEFWDWRLRVAKAELQRHEDEAREERGE